jgi:hypothetical protein
VPKSEALMGLVKAHFALEDLPDEILIPAVGPYRRPAAKLVCDATLDDLAFALNLVEEEFNAVGDRLHAIRRLYTIGRRAGGLGNDLAVAVASAARNGPVKH